MNAVDEILRARDVLTETLGRVDLDDTVVLWHSGKRPFGSLFLLNGEPILDLINNSFVQFVLTNLINGFELKVGDTLAMPYQTLGADILATGETLVARDYPNDPRAAEVVLDARSPFYNAESYTHQVVPEPQRHLIPKKYPL